MHSLRLGFLDALYDPVQREIWRSFRHHSRTFSLAAFLLPRKVQSHVAVLYLFCRRIDTIADERSRELGNEGALAELRQAEHDLRDTLSGNPPERRLWRQLASVHERYELDDGPLLELIAGAEWDLTGRTVRDEDDLIHYSNLVGGSVGAMMLPFLVGQQNAQLERCARDLGIGMQITNILRDVGEDHRELDRHYLPELDAFDLATAPTSGDGYERYLERWMTLSESYYEAGSAGICDLPGGARRGIRAAARMYREIMNEVRANDYDNLTRRAYVRLPRKAHLIFRDDYERRKRQLLARSR